MQQHSNKTKTLKVVPPSITIGVKNRIWQPRPRHPKVVACASHWVKATVAGHTHSRIPYPEMTDHPLLVGVAYQGKVPTSQITVLAVSFAPSVETVHITMMIAVRDQRTRTGLIVQSM